MWGRTQVSGFVRISLVFDVQAAGSKILASRGFLIEEVIDRCARDAGRSIAIGCAASGDKVQVGDVQLNVSTANCLDKVFDQAEDEERSE
jgi:hypothetical protein